MKLCYIKVTLVYICSDGNNPENSDHLLDVNWKLKTNENHLDFSSTTKKIELWRHYKDKKTYTHKTFKNRVLSKDKDLKPRKYS